MKFRAVLSDNGLGLLKKGVLPTLEKFGKSSQVLLTAEAVIFIQETSQTDGLQVVARISTAVLFEPTETFLLESRHGNEIAFVFEVPLMKNALTFGNNADPVEMGLTMRRVEVGNGQSESHPCLSFSSKSEDFNVSQWLPISEPFRRQAVDRLKSEIESIPLCEYYMDIQPHVGQIQNIVEQMNRIGEAFTLATMQTGEMYLEFSDLEALVGAEVGQLVVFPQDKVKQHQGQRSESVETRVREAIDNGEALVAHVFYRHFLKSIAASQIIAPPQLLCGIGENGDYVHFMPSNQMGIDDALNLTFTLPTKEED